MFSKQSSDPNTLAIIANIQLSHKVERPKQYEIVGARAGGLQMVATTMRTELITILLKLVPEDAYDRPDEGVETKAKADTGASWLDR